MLLNIERLDGRVRNGYKAVLRTQLSEARVSDRYFFKIRLIN